MKNSTSLTPAAPPLERMAPARAPSAHSDATVPLRQAAISAALIGFCVAMLCGLMIMLFNKRLEQGHLVFLGGLWFVVATLVLTVMWFVQLNAAQRTIWTIERLIGEDLNNDQQVGEPLRWVPINSAGAPKQSAPADRTAQRFEAFINMAYAHHGKTDIRTARQAGYTDREWAAFMAALESAGMVERTRGGENSPRRLLAPTAHACIMTMRQRGLFVGGVS